MMPAPLLYVSPYPSIVGCISSHDTVCHVHKGAAHPAPWPRALEMVCRVERLFCHRHARRFDARKKRQSLHSLPPITAIHIILPIEFDPVDVFIIAVHAPSRLLEAHPIWRPRCAIGPGLCERRLPLCVANWTGSRGCWRRGRGSR
jgi:hypothetical protein